MLSKALLLSYISSLEEKKLNLPHRGGGKEAWQAVLRQMVFFLCVPISKHRELALTLTLSSHG